MAFAFLVALGEVLDAESREMLSTMLPVALGSVHTALCIHSVQWWGFRWPKLRAGFHTLLTALGCQAVVSQHCVAEWSGRIFKCVFSACDLTVVQPQRLRAKITASGLQQWARCRMAGILGQSTLLLRLEANLNLTITPPSACGAVTLL